MWPWSFLLLLCEMSSLNKNDTPEKWLQFYIIPSGLSSSRLPCLKSTHVIFFFIPAAISCMHVKQKKKKSRKLEKLKFSNWTIARFPFCPFSNWAQNQGNRRNVLFLGGVCQKRMKKTSCCLVILALVLFWKTDEWMMTRILNALNPNSPLSARALEQRVVSSQRERERERSQLPSGFFPTRSRNAVKLNARPSVCSLESSSQHFWGRAAEWRRAEGKRSQSRLVVWGFGFKEKKIPAVLSVPSGGERGGRRRRAW